MQRIAAGAARARASVDLVVLDAAWTSVEEHGAVSTSPVARALVGGDTVRDLQAGVNAGAPLVGVLTGGHDAATLGAVRHTHLLPGVKDIPALVLRH